MQDYNPYRSPSGASEASIESSGHAGPMNRWRSSVPVLVAAIGGALVWALSPWLTGHQEPWDSPTMYYWAGIAAAAGVGGMFGRMRIWLPMIGVYLGQVLYCLMFYHPGGPIILPIAVSAAVFGGIPSLFGAWVGDIVASLLQRSSTGSNRQR